VHLHAIGHPILGDALYAPPAVRDAAGRLLLHASELGLAHPTSGAALRLRCVAPF
jgi:tRNA pseudouridine32 synthase/23S rRNA pseudouridine746 synthase